MTSIAGRSDASLRSELLHDVAWGLSRPQKELPPKYFYDRRGSELFDEITRLPEYYLTRTERALLECWSTPLMVALRPRALVELGAGSADKTRRLLDAMVYAGSGEVYVPIDVSAEFLDDAAARLRDEYPTLGIDPVVGDITDPLGLDPGLPRPALIGFLGSTIGNFDAAEARALLENVAVAMRPGDRFLLGADLRKNPAVIEAAYNDSQGITAEFNLNVLRVLNRDLGASFDLSRFEHRAFYERAAHRIEMHLVSTDDQRVTIPGVGEIAFAGGESIRTEISCKYDRASLDAMLGDAGMVIERWISDAAQTYALVVAALARDGSTRA
ncbi:MAG TPA: L-histidine N(alpha)-methyltransferase [Gemmatimonadaceae bacterium]|nr:L-histidine N(alpha)-methyltransferase [Gemmatimonadaceae bacterium]